MDELTASQWILVFVADAGAVVFGAGIAWALSLTGRRKSGLVLAGACSLPAIGGIWALVSQSGHENECVVLCWSAYESHWVGWTIGWVMATPFIVATLIAVVWSLRHLRSPAS